MTDDPDAPFTRRLIDQPEGRVVVTVPDEAVGGNVAVSIARPTSGKVAATRSVTRREVN